MTSTDHKLTLALNKRIDEETLLHVAMSLSLGLVSSVEPESREKMRFLTFKDASGEEHSHISALSLIVMRGKTGDLKKFHLKALQSNLSCVSVTRSQWTDLGGEAPRSPGSDDDYLGVMVFGEKPIVESSTGRLSLWR